MFTEVSFIISKATVRVERASILHVASKCRPSRRLWPKSAAMTWSPDLRTNMTKERLNNLMVLHVHKPRTDSLDMIEVANSFADTEHRQSIFGKFSQRDIIKPAEKKTKGKQTDPISKEEN